MVLRTHVAQSILYNFRHVSVLMRKDQSLPMHVWDAQKIFFRAMYFCENERSDTSESGWKFVFFCWKKSLWLHCEKIKNLRCNDQIFDAKICRYYDWLMRKDHGHLVQISVFLPKSTSWEPSLEAKRSITSACGKTLGWFDAVWQRQAQSSWLSDTGYCKEYSRML